MFSVIENREQLILAWIQDGDETKQRAILMQRHYRQIQIKGFMNNYSLFTDYAVFLRTKTIYLSNCQLDFNQLQGQFNYIKLENCECINDIVNCKCKELHVENTIISAEQIYKLNVLAQVDIIGSNIDYQNIYLLTTPTINITLNDCNVNLSVFKGNFTYITLNKCKISQMAQNFKAKQVTIGNCQFNTESLENLDCQSLYISESGNKSFQLPLKSQATEKIAYLTGCVLDLSGVADNWSSLDCKECVLKRNNVIQHLQGGQSAYLKLKQCTIQDIDQLEGKWYHIYIQECSFGIQHTITQKIFSQSVKIENTNISDFFCFQTAHLKISNCIVKQIPQDSNLVLESCQLKFILKQPKVFELSIKNCTLIQFSLRFFPDVKNISFSGNMPYQIVVRNFLKSTKNMQSKQISQKKRIVQELNRIVPKRIYIQNIQFCYSLIIDICEQYNSGFE
ncbi:Hypothetical_protein [Hexamita inflata]|uniref:Hypothetical_protein n=1 Tax=Hexamita inflata TaxID=28002 RepID=A0AA86UIU5_9EUKA|nr:Hypothetical protein HINF_LOCUS45089 [Hexamita inflata]